MVHWCKQLLQLPKPAAPTLEAISNCCSASHVGGQADMPSCLHDARCKLHQGIANVSQHSEAVEYQRPAEVHGIRQTYLHGLGFCLKLVPFITNRILVDLFCHSVAQKLKK
jgi:hypothetical protein